MDCSIAVSLPELPDAKHARFIATFVSFQPYDADVLVVSERETADFFETVARAATASQPRTG